MPKHPYFLIHKQGNYKFLDLSVFFTETTTIIKERIFAFDAAGKIFHSNKRRPPNESFSY